METVYHPALFRTSYYQPRRFGIFISVDVCTCAFCGRLGGSTKVRKGVRGSPVGKGPRATYPCGFCSRPQATRFCDRKKSSLVSSMLDTSSTFMKLSEVQSFLVNCSKGLRSEIQEVAFEEGFGCVTKRFSETRKRPFIKGLHLASIKV